MYEDETQSTILARMLARVNSGLDKREGSIIYDATAPASVELAQLYIALGNVLDKVFADTAPREYLIRRAAERGLSPDSATYAVGVGAFTGTMPTVGARFSGKSYNWAVTEIRDGVYYLTCETPGDDPNGDLGQLLPIEYIEGLETAHLTSIAIYGEDEEETEHFRQKYFNSFSGLAFGGNKKDYYDKITSQPGVGGCKVFRATNAAGEKVGGHVLAVITDSEYGVPTTALVETVQQVIDPKQDQEGDGLASIGHICHIQAVTGRSIAVAASITYGDGYSFSTLKASIESVIDEYLAALNKTWDSETRLTVRLSSIESRILGIPGIIDIAGTTLNGSESNITLGEKEIAIRGEVSG